MGTSILHIKTEIDCHVLLFDEEKGIAKAGTYFNLEVRKGEQDLVFVSTEDETVRFQLLYGVEENDHDYKIVIEKTMFKKYNSESLKDIRSAEQGNADAQYELGWNYENGNGVEQNLEEAVKWYRKAAEQGHCYAQFNLGVCYENGDGVEEDYEEAIKWYRNAAENGCAEAQCNLGWYYKHNAIDRDQEEAVKWFRKSAEQGCVEAQFFLAECCAFAEGMEQNNEEALEWYRKAAEQGYADAQFELGQYYRHGFVIEKDQVEALKWFIRAAEQGSAKAQSVVGFCYEHGMGVEQDFEKAWAWYDKAFEQGYGDGSHSIVLQEKIRNRDKELSPKQPYYLFFDTETTGVPKDHNAPANNTQNWPRLVQLGWILTDEDGRELSSGNEIIKPEGFVIPFDAAKVHGITTEKALCEGKPLRSVIELFLRDSKQAKFFVGHNITFDQKVVGAELYRLGITDSVSIKKSLCTMKAGVDFCKIPGFKSYRYPSYCGYRYPKLQELYKGLFGIEFADAHNAKADIKATKECFFEMKRRGLI